MNKEELSAYALCCHLFISIYSTETLKGFTIKRFGYFSPCGGTAQIRPNPPLCEVAKITHTHTQLVALL